MLVNTKFLKGYFLWSIPFLLLACNDAPGTAVFLPPDPKNCEWYVKQEKKEADNSNQLGLYALRFYPDGNYTLCADLLFEQGKWSYDAEKKLLVLVPSVKTEELKERYLLDQKPEAGKTQFSFFQTYPPDKANPYELVNVFAITNRSKADPFKAAMHNWRSKPAHEETDAQIKQRVLAYLQFMLAFYQHAADNDLENAGGNWYPQPIKFYSNKVSMAYENELSDWYSCFFSKEEAVKGYQLISGALMKVKIEGEDDVSRNINCLQQLINLIQ